MIDPGRLVSNGVWILGLALVLAAWSYACWWARQRGLRFRQVVNEPVFATPFGCGFALFCLGLALRGRSWWETAGWGVLTVLSLLLGFHSWRTSRQRARAGKDRAVGPDGSADV
jgi:hypothetical protein